MAEPLTLQLVAELLGDLDAAYPRHIKPENTQATAHVYRNGLSGLSGDAVRYAVKRAMQESEYFPKIAKLRELAESWERHNLKSSTTVLMDRDPLYCPACTGRATERVRWSPMVDEKDQWRPLLSADGLWLLLVSKQRLLCDCASGCLFVPVEGISPPAMRSEKAPMFVLRRAKLGKLQPLEVAA